MNKFYKKNRGFSLVEVLIACMIISTTSIALMSASSKGIELSNKALRQAQASGLTEEGVEAVRSIRDNDWNIISGLNVDTDYYLSFNTNSNTWSLSTTPVGLVDDRFTRKVVFSDVYRDSNDDIASSGTLDTNIRRVKVVVSWNDQNNTKDITFYLADIFN